MTPVESRFSKLGPKVVEALKARHFEAYYYATKAEAAQKVLSLIPREHRVSWGGSMTMVELGIQAALEKAGNPLIDRDKAPNPEARWEAMRQALLADTFLMSANAITEDGEIVNIDGNGNRVAAMVFGPKQVILAAGLNKVVHTLEDAVERARTIAAPLNAQRFPKGKTPCNTTGCCADCKGLDSVCSYIVTARLCRPAGRIKVVLIGEEIGL
jgi:L-lactate utilization protein LutB